MWRNTGARLSYIDARIHGISSNCIGTSFPKPSRLSTTQRSFDFRKCVHRCVFCIQVVAPLQTLFLSTIQGTVIKQVYTIYVWQDSGHFMPIWWMDRIADWDRFYNWWSNYQHDDVIKWKQFPRYWPFVRGIHRSPRSFGVFFDLRLNKQLNKQSWGWWFDTPWRSLWRHCNATRTN